MKYEKDLPILLILMLILDSSLFALCRESHPDKSGLLRPRRKLNSDNERLRLLRILLQDSHIYKGSKKRGRKRFDTNTGKDNEFQLEDFDDHSVRPNSRERKRFYEVIDGNEVELNSSYSCCPQKFEMIQPTYGRNRTGHMVELYSDERVKQRFYELICDPEFANRPCRFLQGQNYKRSKCTQQHAYTYALVRWDESAESPTGWSLDHIRIRNGCVCQVAPHIKKKHRYESDYEMSSRDSRSRMRPRG